MIWAAWNNARLLIEHIDLAGSRGLLAHTRLPNSFFKSLSNEVGAIQI